jgi:UDP-N-acetylmuramate dehydrogenase
MKIMHDVPLALYSTMRLGGKAKSVVHVRTKEELLEALTWAKKDDLAVVMIGLGSNIVWRDEGFNGLIIVNEFPGYEVTLDDDENYYIRVGAGENWDSVVERSVADKASGIEALSLIPGSTGATPVQNVGAYGQEISETLFSLEAYDNTKKTFVILSNQDCGFSYRSSIFKETKKGRYFIISLNLRLTKTHLKLPLYQSLQDYLNENDITDHSPYTIRKAVIAIRSSKLPDPALVANNGSFFANPIIDNDTFAKLKLVHPTIKHWPVGKSKQKLAAAWLIEKSGFKDIHDRATGMATWPTQPLILVNEKAKTTADLLEFKKKIIDSVKENFGVTLIQEPEFLP